MTDHPELNRMIRDILTAILDCGAGGYKQLEQLKGKIRGELLHAYDLGVASAQSRAGAAAVMGRATSKRKAAAARRNASKPPRPGSRPRGRPRHRRRNTDCTGTPPLPPC